MTALDEIFCGLPYGFSSFASVSGRLIDCRAKARLPENAETVISVLFPYYLGEDYYKNANVSRYAVSADYHEITGAIMEKIVSSLQARYPENVFVPFVDNSPLPEVRCAVNAGLGVMGKNTLFINREYGSWVFLGEIVTDRYFPPAAPAEKTCIGCDRCKEACPVGAVTDGGILPEKCLSYLSQKKGELPQAVADKMAQYHCAWGCDICQQVCPMNTRARLTPIEAFFETARPFVKPGDPVEGRAFAWRGKAVIERNLSAVAAVEYTAKRKEQDQDETDNCDRKQG
ncbi:MAG: DUF1730 domain-containing protein [Clostridia bacterium]|nr:DUF1730 domain-containing protein [Clostridia bacterium]